MPATRLTMRKIREVLRLAFESPVDQAPDRHQLLHRQKHRLRVPHALCRFGAGMASIGASRRCQAGEPAASYRSKLRGIRPIEIQAPSQIHREYLTIRAKYSSNTKSKSPRMTLCRSTKWRTFSSSMPSMIGVEQRPLIKPWRSKVVCILDPARRGIPVPLVRLIAERLGQGLSHIAMPGRCDSLDALSSVSALPNSTSPTEPAKTTPFPARNRD
jgi:hypothetical protein